MWIIKGTLTGVLLFIAGFIAYILSVASVTFPSGGNYDIRGLIHGVPGGPLVVLLAPIGSIVVCCAIFKFLPSALRRE